ncbi:MAG: GAF domain-containing protein [Vicinamibacterales bacterium]
MDSTLGSMIALECEALVLRLRPALGASIGVFFRYDGTQDELVAQHVSSDSDIRLAATRIALGQNLSGWVAANRQQIVNSDAALDLGRVADEMSPPVKSCMSMAVTADTELVGVLSWYAVARFSVESEALCRRSIDEIIEGARATEAAQRLPLRFQVAS